MAAIAIPIATTIAPLVIPWVVKLMDKIFGPKTGSVKMATGIANAEAIFKALQPILAAQGIAVPAATEIPALMQSVVDALNASGELKGAATVLEPAPPADNSAFIIQLLEMATGLMKKKGIA